MKKKIVVSIFTFLILATAVFFVVSGVRTFIFPSRPAEGIERIAGAFWLVLGGIVVFYELDLFYTVYSLFVKNPSPARTVLLVLSHGALLLAFLIDPLCTLLRDDFPGILALDEETIFVLLGIYAILRALVFMVSVMRSDSVQV